MLWYGASNADSIAIYLDWLMRFAAQVAHGDIYPRWLMDMNRGAGSPAFYYYAPMAYYIGSVPALLLSDFKPTIQLAWADWLLIVLSGLTFYCCARARFEFRVALPCALLYMLLPYHFEIDMAARQDLGELANYIWVPLVLHYTGRLFEGRSGVAGLSVSYGLMVLSHLPTTLLFSICLAMYVLAQTLSRRSWIPLTRFASSIVIGCLLAGIYWVPALFSQALVRMNAMWDVGVDFHTWFFPVRPLQDFQEDYQARDFALRVWDGVVLTTIMFASCWSVAMYRRTKADVRELIGCMMLVSIAWFMMSPLSTPIWEYAPQLWKVQFPWRLSMVVDLATCIAALYALRALFDHRDIVSAAAVAISVGLLALWLATTQIGTLIDPFYSPEWRAERDSHLHDGVDVAEYTTAWNPTQRHFDTSLELGNRLQVIFDSKKGAIAVAHWWPRDIALGIDLRKPAIVSVRQFYMPNWRATVKGGAQLLVEPSKKDGLIEISLPAGQYAVSLRLEPLRTEVIGATMTVVGLTLMAFVVFWGMVRNTSMEASRMPHSAAPRYR